MPNTRLIVDFDLSRLWAGITDDAGDIEINCSH